MAHAPSSMGQVIGADSSGVRGGGCERVAAAPGVYTEMPAFCALAMR